MALKIEKDALTGVESTGHSWDGIQELNNPLPNWWLLIWGGCILTALIQFVIYPSFPGISSYWHGTTNYSSRVDVVKAVDEIQASHAQYVTKIAAMPITEIPKNKELYDYALLSGKVTFANNCQPCHGVAGSGRPGFPVLASDAWLWGGTLDALQQTITYGIRSGHPQARDLALTASSPQRRSAPWRNTLNSLKESPVRAPISRRPSNCSWIIVPPATAPRAMVIATLARRAIMIACSSTAQTTTRSCVR